MIGARFRPGGAAAFFPLPAAELHNRVVPADALWGRFAAELRERLFDAPTPAARFGLLEQLLLARLHDEPRGLDLVRYAVDAIAREKGRHADLSCGRWRSGSGRRAGRRGGRPGAAAQDSIGPGARQWLHSLGWDSEGNRVGLFSAE
jgi:hypothetical protein